MFISCLCGFTPWCIHYAGFLPLLPYLVNPYLLQEQLKFDFKKRNLLFFFLKHFVPLLGYSSHCTVIYRFIQLSHSLKAHRRYSVKIWWMNKCMKCGRQKLHFNHFSITMNLLRGKQTMAFGPNLVCGLFLFFN